MSKIAVVDCGTNTFHMSIAKIDPDGLVLPAILFEKREFVYLFKESPKYIGETAYANSLKVLAGFKGIIEGHGDVIAQRFIGTAGLRSATNGSQLLSEIQQKVGIEIELIDGNREAQLIFRGVRAAINLKAYNQRTISMDIGGGSVEYIIAEGETILWAKSYPIGLGVLQNYCNQAHNLSAVQQEELGAFLLNELADLRAAIRVFSPSIFIGVSGTFDVFEAFLSDTEAHSIQLDRVEDFYTKFVNMPLEAREREPLMPQNRAGLLPVALVLIKTSLDMVTPNKLLVSNYSLRQGLIYELFDQIN
jgi:exopolyphosphatase/guanosine-5'-triphosphate,3'-diphosphate pyrophosphatase